MFRNKLSYNFSDIKKIIRTKNGGIFLIVGWRVLTIDTFAIGADEFMHSLNSYRNKKYFLKHKN